MKTRQNVKLNKIMSLSSVCFPLSNGPVIGNGGGVSIFVAAIDNPTASVLFCFCKEVPPWCREGASWWKGVKGNHSCWHSWQSRQEAPVLAVKLEHFFPTLQVQPQFREKWTLTCLSSLGFVRILARNFNLISQCIAGRWVNRITKCDFIASLF